MPMVFNVFSQQAPTRAEYCNTSRHLRLWRARYRGPAPPARRHAPVWSVLFHDQQHRLRTLECRVVGISGAEITVHVVARKLVPLHPDWGQTNSASAVVGIANKFALQTRLRLFSQAIVHSR